MKRKKCVLKEEEILALLRLQKTPSIGDILAKKLIATVGSAADIFTENKNTLLKINGIGEYAVRNLLNNTQQKLAEKELQYINTHKIKYSYFLDDDYPKTSTIISHGSGYYNRNNSFVRKINRTSFKK